MSGREQDAKDQNGPGQDGPGQDGQDQTDSQDQTGPQDQDDPGQIGSQLTEIWQQIFEVDADEIDPEESLFEIGGTSLQAVQLMTRIEESFGVRIELPVVFAEGSIGRLTELIEEDLLASLDGLTEEEARLLLREETERSG